MVIETQRHNRKAPKQADKYNQGWDVAKEMVEILSLHDTKRFINNQICAISIIFSKYRLMFSQFPISDTFTDN